MCLCVGGDREVSRGPSILEATTTGSVEDLPLPELDTVEGVEDGVEVGVGDIKACS